MRLDKFICKSTDLTRAEATQLINVGHVTVNNEVVSNEATQVHENNDVLLDGEKLIARASRYILMHKPLDTICSNIDEVYPSLFNYIDVEKADDLHIAGRLDADTTGLVLITDDGRWSFNIITPNKQCEKTYRVELRDPIAEDAAEKFAQGVQLQGEKQLTLPAKLDVVTSNEVLLTITEGKYHQVKRMFSAIGNRVVTLHREQIGNIKLDVEVGKWRFLTPEEIAYFK
ncbi:16S rRNA pseudouridine(516) synthase [Photobacterium frigidiphilum]|uniref:Pseudouridine synthase n=1 Tax=Photobacterium frigidiphilum TaxID=264736 RepID=A0A2T3JEW4_9GAMM|nr:pseudouridine synthase [Photobacterium frigidiphilum]PSU47418.1 16S rRNA pseudouridine(516) synthase [Photobacterium frigidiphilum]